MTECEPDSPPAKQSVFSIAIRPIHHEKSFRATCQSLPCSVHTTATQDLFPSSSPARANPRATERRHSFHREALPEPTPGAVIQQDMPVRARPKHDVRAKSRHNAVTTMRHTQIRMMLLRCQVLQATILSLGCRRESSKTAVAIQTHFETMQNLARQACLLSQGLNDADLLAKSEYWTGRARACMERQDELFNRCKTMPVLGHICRSNEDEKDSGSGVTANGVQGNNSSLRDTAQRNAGTKICDRSAPSLRLQKCMAQRRDTLFPEQSLTVKDELDAVLECLDHEDGYGDLIDYLDDGETFDPLRLLSCARRD